MKKTCLLLVFYFFTINTISAADKYWVGPLDGKWDNDLNWSFVKEGTGGAGIPGTTDKVIFSISARVRVDVSSTIYSLQTESFSNSTILLYTSTGSVITILNNLSVAPFSILKDSTSANVPFSVVLNGATGANASILGDWVFEGGVPLSGSANNGAGFTAEAGSFVLVSSVYLFGWGQGGRIIFKKNTNTISSTPATLKFSYNSSYIIDNNLDATIPAATWSEDSVQAPNTYSGVLGAPASTIMLLGNIERLKIAGGVPKYGRFVIDLPALAADADLSLPDGTKISGNLEILNTNNHTVTLLASTSTTSTVQLELGTIYAGYLFGGYLLVRGNTTKVALAKATAAAPATSYKLLVNKSFNQAGGNFSLQDFNEATGSSTLTIRNDFIQTGGSFYTNSTSTSAKFMVVMDAPNFITGPSGNFSSSRIISLSSGTIDNNNHTVTLKIDHELYNIPGFESYPNGVILQSPLITGRLELARSPLTTSATNMLTITDPSPGAIVVGNTGKSYVNGPLRRATNSTQSYLFPTGKGNASTAPYVFDSCVVIPTSTTASIYQAEYFFTGYAGANVKAPLKGASTSEYWDISRIAGSDAVIKLGLNAAVAGAAASDGLVVAHVVNSNWITEHGSMLTPGNTTAGSVLSKHLSTFGIFTLGYGNQADLHVDPTNLPGRGLTYKFYQGKYTDLPDFHTLTPVLTGTSPNVDISVRPASAEEAFAFMWEGYISIPTPGVYTFEIISDDGSKLYFNTPYGLDHAAVVNNDGTHHSKTETGTVNITTAGIYPVTITFFENYGVQGIQVYWSGPGIERQLIPDAAFTSVTPASISGLNYKYYEGDFDSLPDFNRLTPVKTGISTAIDLSTRTPGVNDHFAFIWQGYINIPTAGNYIFETISDDGSKIYINTGYAADSLSLVSNDGVHSPLSAKASVNIPAAGMYPITAAFFEKDGNEIMQVYWTGPGIDRQLVPATVFTTTNGFSNLAGVAMLNSQKPAALTIDTEKAGAEIRKIYPNPFTESFTVEYYNSGSRNNKLSIGIYDLKGKLLYSHQPGNLVAGQNRMMVNMAGKNLPDGVYLVRLQVNGIPATTMKLVKAKR